MERRSRSPETRHRRHRRRSRSWSRSRSRDRSRDRRRRHSRSRSRSRDRNYRRGSPDLYKDLIDQDYQNDRERYTNRNDGRSKDRDGRRDKDKHYRREHSTESYLEEINSNDSFDSDQVNSEYYRNQTPSNKIIILGLAQHITESDINNDLIHYGLQPVSIRLIRKRKTGASRGFAFVEFNTEEEATRWMEYKQGVLMVQDQYRAVMQYSVGKDKIVTDWYCAKCGVFNFKRRENCFKCYASREESEKGGEGSDEISNILTKKIMLRNLDVLTNEEGVLTVMQEFVPTLVSKISKILICRDPLTSTSRGICYLSFENLVDSMNVHSALKAIEPSLVIENREVLVSYCVDSENKNINKSATGGGNGKSSQMDGYSSNTHHYTLADVPRLAEYSASMYASTPAEHDHYYKYYTDYYVGQISKGQYANLPTMSQIGETANSGAAVALSAIQRKQKQQFKATGGATSVAAAIQSNVIQVPNGKDRKKYPTPDTSLYQYDETSGYYYDPQTGLYYDANSQYYYNNETGAYLYWDQENSTYTIADAGASAAAAAGAASSASASAGSASSGPAATILTSDQANDTETALVAPAPPCITPQEDIFAKPNADERKDKKESKHDKVKVAKKIVKDMERWAKQLNQKKDMNILQPPVPVKEEEPINKYMSKSGYADVGFSILENKERSKISMDMTMGGGSVAAAAQINKIVPSYGSDSDNEQNDQANSAPIVGSSSSGGGGGDTSSNVSERDYVEFDKLTCLLCKRAFQSLEILNKHLKMSNLHKENLQKYNLSKGLGGEIGGSSNNGSGAYAATSGSNLSYRDRAKERRLKYGESDPPPPNRSRERFEKEIQKHTIAIQAQTSNKLASTPIGENNVGNRLLQKMGWSEGQGLGRSNQGRTNIIEAESRAPAAGLGTKSTNFAPGDDYKSYIKRMMKSRYEQVDYS